MNPQSALGLVVAYYLSKYDPEAYANLGYHTRNAAHLGIGKRLGVNPNSIKNMRDEFDAVNDNSRVGWYQRDLRPSRKKVVEMFQDMSEPELRDVVIEILNRQTVEPDEDFDHILDSIAQPEKKKAQKTRPFILRGPTGRKAEEYFINYHSTTGRPYPGKLVDTRDQGCGYDFRLETPNQDYLIEVKGLDAASGGIAFTAKEWQVARDCGDRYFLIIVSSLNDAPAVKIIRNPASQFQPKKSIFTIVQISWQVPKTILAGVSGEE